ncbi:MAG: B12-binding domain-containing radical SAM protein [Oscillospiraceae bacterium]|nr:B12-binding domain-containing radical SAM protein [Oscillospiraceae bacterium]
MKKALLITVSSDEIKKIRRARYIKFQQCTMPYLAALFPPDWEVVHIDEETQPIDYTSHYDLVGLTFHTPCCYHAYEIAKRFRDRGTTVIMGGPHVTLVPDEAEKHADSIFIGEAENTLPLFCSDFAQGTTKKRYEDNGVVDLASAPLLQKQHFHRTDHTAGTMFATRGCPNSCEFCTIACIYKNKFRKRPVSEVAKDFSSLKGKVVVFWDDNISADLEYAKMMFRAITPYKKWWTSQASIKAGEDDEFLELAYKSGCRHLFIGFESVAQLSLDGANKSFNKVARYKEIIRRIHSHGISIQAGIVFGFDHDTPDVFDETLAFLRENGISQATFNMLTPYPGTPLFERLRLEGRILTNDWTKYNSRTDVVFQPKNMTPEALLAGFRRANREFYQLGNIVSRLFRSRTNLFWTLPLNLIYHVLLKLNKTAG